jgi:hypothetical protein
VTQWCPNSVHQLGFRGPRRHVDCRQAGPQVRKWSGQIYQLFGSRHALLRAATKAMIKEYQPSVAAIVSVPKGRVQEILLATQDHLNAEYNHQGERLLERAPVDPREQSWILVLRDGRRELDGIRLEWTVPDVGRVVRSAIFRATASNSLIRPLTEYNGVEERFPGHT